eukprot:5354316-Prymnesium_polylepis.1
MPVLPSFGEASCIAYEQAAHIRFEVVPLQQRTHHVVATGRHGLRGYVAPAQRDELGGQVFEVGADEGKVNAVLEQRLEPQRPMRALSHDGAPHQQFGGQARLVAAPVDLDLIPVAEELLKRNPRHQARLQPPIDLLLGNAA